MGSLDAALVKRQAGARVIGRLDQYLGGDGWGLGEHLSPDRASPFFKKEKKKGRIFKSSRIHFPGGSLR